MRQFLVQCAVAFVAFGVVDAQAQVPTNAYSYSRSSAFTYDDTTGLLTSETVEPDNLALCVTTTYQYDAYGNKTGTSTANCSGASGLALFATRGNATSYTAQSATGANAGIPAGTVPVTVTNALSESETHKFDPRFGAVTSLTGPNALTTTVETDDFGRTVRELRADGTSTISAYCFVPNRGIVDVSSASAACPAVSDAEIPADAVSFVHSESRLTATGAKSGPFSRIYMDRAGRKIRAVTEGFDDANQSGGSGRLIAQDTDYNAQGVVTVTTQPYFLLTGASTAGGSGGYGMSLTVYDVLGRPTQVYTTTASGSQGAVPFGARGSRQASLTSMLYQGLKTTTTNDQGKTRVEEKDVDGKVVRVTDALGAQLAHQYDAFGNLVQTKDALQNVVAIYYDIRGHKVRMVDPDAGGEWQYQYDALGELVWQRSPNEGALGQITQMAYDVLGRMVKRIDPEYTSTWVYDSCTKGIGKLCSSSTTNGVQRTYSYDVLGRPLSSRTDVTGGPSFASAVSYDASGRVSTQTYPTGLQVGYNYTGNGALRTMTLLTAGNLTPLPATVGGVPGAPMVLAANSVLWQALSYNAWGKAEQQIYGNGVVGRANYDAMTGQVTGSSAGTSLAPTTVLNYTYAWDSLNQLSARTDANGDGSSGAVTDNLSYDAIGRLQSYIVSAPAIPGLRRAVGMQYNALGSMLYKSDVGVYSYPAQGGAHPHALQSVAGAFSASYTYDKNGNVLTASAGGYSAISYTSFDLPDSKNGLQGVTGGPQYQWLYDENHQRIKEMHITASGTRTTWMLHPDNVGGLGFESEQNGGVTSNRHYLTVGGASIGVLVSAGNLPALAAGATTPGILASIGLVKVEYWHKDHLDSLAATTDHLGAVTARYSYDPFGKRRTASGNYDANGALVYDWNQTSSGTDRGYTGHEQLDDVGVVHMNGRLFDPRLGIFMQGDPYIQDPLNLQNYNRYGYCYNNPMTCTDPSGHFSLGGIGHFLWKAATFDPTGVTPAIARSKAGYTIGSIVIGVLSVVYCEEGAAECNAEGQMIWAGFAGRSFRDAARTGIIAGATSAAFNYVGTNYPVGQGTENLVFQNTVGHVIVGCASSEASGGSCRSGAFAAGFSAAWDNYGPGFAKGTSSDVIIQNTITAAAVGGVGSVLGGGKFANGVETGAFGYLFNSFLHNGNEYATVPEGFINTLKDIQAGAYLTVDQLIATVTDLPSGSTGTVVKYQLAVAFFDGSVSVKDSGVSSAYLGLRPYGLLSYSVTTEEQWKGGNTSGFTLKGSTSIGFGAGLSLSGAIYSGHMGDLGGASAGVGVTGKAGLSRIYGFSPPAPGFGWTFKY